MTTKVTMELVGVLPRFGHRQHSSIAYTDAAGSSSIAAADIASFAADCPSAVAASVAAAVVGLTNWPSFCWRRLILLRAPLLGSAHS